MFVGVVVAEDVTVVVLVEVSDVVGEVVVVWEVVPVVVTVNVGVDVAVVV